LDMPTEDAMESERTPSEAQPLTDAEGLRPQIRPSKSVNWCHARGWQGHRFKHIPIRDHLTHAFFSEAGYGHTALFSAGVYAREEARAKAYPEGGLAGWCGVGAGRAGAESRRGVVVDVT